MRYMKWMLCVLMLFTMHLGVQAETPIDVVVNGHYIKMDQAPFMERDRTLVPIRFVSEALACSVEWKDNGQVVIEDETTEVVLTVGSKKAQVNGKEIRLDVPARIVGGRTFVPVRFISEGMGAVVTWHQTACTVQIQKDGVGVPESSINRDYTAKDLEWLSKIVHAEAQGESMDGKIAVANVVLNRVRDAQFPDTIYDVIFDRNFGVQFTPVANGAIYNNPSQDSVRAAKQALFGQDRAGKSLYFCNPVTSTSNWIIKNRPLYKIIGKHNFYL